MVKAASARESLEPAPINLPLRHRGRHARIYFGTEDLVVFGERFQVRMLIWKCREKLTEGETSCVSRKGHRIG